MPQRMARNVDHREALVHHLDRVAFAQRHIAPRDRLARRPPHPGPVGLGQLGNAADVIAMVMSD